MSGLIAIDHNLLNRVVTLLMIMEEQADWIIPRKNSAVTLAQIKSVLKDVRQELNTPCVPINTLEEGHFPPGILPDNITDKLIIMNDIAEIISSIYITPENIQEEITRNYG